MVNEAVRWFRKRFSGSKGRSKQHIPRTLRPKTEHKIGLMVTEYKVFIERIAWYSVGIVNPFASVNHKEKRMADDIGTGTACTWKGHKLILTAEHVIAEAEPKDLAFFLRVDDAISWEGAGKPEKGIARVSLPIEKIVRCVEHDLAAIVLRTKDLTGSSMQFCELSKHLSKRRTLKRKGSLILLGYPKDRIFNVSKTKIANAETHFNAARPTILKATIAKPLRRVCCHIVTDRSATFCFTTLRMIRTWNLTVLVERLFGGIVQNTPCPCGLLNRWYSVS